jgi:hypothetical protein
MSDLLPLLMLVTPTATVVLACRHLNRRDMRRPQTITPLAGELPRPNP